MEGIRIGLQGAGSAVVDAYGVVHPDGWRAESCGWWLAASDKWHDPRTSPSVRQQRIDGTPVVQTKIGVPGGDVVQRVFVVADRGGRLVMQVSNESPEPVAVAVPTREMSSTAAAGASRPQGIDTPEQVMAFPLSHRGSITFTWPLALARFRKTAPIDASLLPSVDQVVRGWVLTSDRASRVAPEAAALVAARCEISLMTAHEIDELLDADPARGMLTIAERVRMGDNPQEWTSQLADAARRVAKHPQRSPWTSRALVMAARTLLAASETLAADDVVELWQRTVHPELFDDEVSMAEAELVRWLSAPTELGRHPDEIEYVGPYTVVADDGPELLHLFRFRMRSPHWSSTRGWLIGAAGRWAHSVYLAEDDCPIDAHVAQLLDSMATWDID